MPLAPGLPLFSPLSTNQCSGKTSFGGCAGFRELGSLLQETGDDAFYERDLRVLEARKLHPLNLRHKAFLSFSRRASIISRRLDLDSVCRKVTGKRLTGKDTKKKTASGHKRQGRGKRCS